MIRFNLKAIICFVPAIFIMAIFQENGNDDMAAISLGLSLVIIDLLLRLFSEDRSMISPKSGGALMFIPVWIIGIFFTMSGLENASEVNFWAIVGLGLGVVIVIVLILAVIGSQKGGNEQVGREPHVFGISPESLGEPSGPPCPICDSALEWIEEHRQWYCWNCNRYPYAIGGAA